MVASSQMVPPFLPIWFLHLQQSVIGHWGWEGSPARIFSGICCELSSSGHTSADSPPHTHTPHYHWGGGSVVPISPTHVPGGATSPAAPSAARHPCSVNVWTNHQWWLDFGCWKLLGVITALCCFHFLPVPERQRFCTQLKKEQTEIKNSAFFPTLKGKYLFPPFILWGLKLVCHNNSIQRIHEEQQDRRTGRGERDGNALPSDVSPPNGLLQEFSPFLPSMMFLMLIGCSQQLKYLLMLSGF